MKAATVAIVGAGHVGVQLADSLRDEGFEGKVLLIGDEAHQPYQRPPLTKEFLHKRASQAEVLPFRAPGMYVERGIDLRLGRRVLHLDREARRIVLDNEETVAYDQLVLATGARSRQFPGVASGGPIHTIRDAFDAIRFDRALDRAVSLTIVGAGFIGLEVAAAARSRDVAVTVVTSRPPLSRIATPMLSAYLLEAHRARGVRFILEDVATIDPSGPRGGATVTTRTGTSVEADVLVVGIGAVANSELAREAGLTVTGGGVEVDAYSRTSDERIWAIGDVATRPGTEGESRREESVQAATHQARCLARTLTGRPTLCTEVPWFWSNQGDIRLQIAGIPSRTTQSVVRGKQSSGRFSVFRFRDEGLVSVESINAPGDHLAARRLLGARAEVTAEQAGDLSFDLKAFSLDAAQHHSAWLTATGASR